MAAALQSPTAYSIQIPATAALWDNPATCSWLSQSTASDHDALVAAARALAAEWPNVYSSGCRKEVFVGTTCGSGWFYAEAESSHTNELAHPLPQVVLTKPISLLRSSRILWDPGSINIGSLRDRRA